MNEKSGTGIRRKYGRAGLPAVISTKAGNQKNPVFLPHSSFCQSQSVAVSRSDFEKGLGNAKG
jgi:hypothetical protein